MNNLNLHLLFSAKGTFITIALALCIIFLELLFPNKSVAQISCPGFTNTVKPANDTYKVTAFGCSPGYKDPNDNCIPSHPPKECTNKGLSGAACEEYLEYFAANVDIFGAGKKLLVTRPDTDKSVVVITIDTGPHCSREVQYGPLLDLSYAAATYLGPAGGNYETAIAKVVADSTPLGPTDGSGVSPEEPGGNRSSGSRTATGCFVTAVGNPNGDSKPVCQTGSVGPAGPCQQAPLAPSDVKQAIIDKWGITLNLPQNQLELAWQEFHEIDCTGFLQDIKGTVVGSWGEAYAQQFSCPGAGGSQVMFSSQWSGEFMKAILVHELTHVWQFCSSDGEQNKILDASAFEKEGGITYYARTGCSFNVDLINEDHADTIALYLNPEQGELTCGGGSPNPFKDGKYPAHRDVAEKGVGKQQ